MCRPDTFSDNLGSPRSGLELLSDLWKCTGVRRTANMHTSSASHVYTCRILEQHNTTHDHTQTKQLAQESDGEG